MTPDQMFEACIPSILKHEGGLTKDKRDPGGTTNWGISLRYLKNMGLDLNGDGVINDEDVIGLHKDGAIDVYRKHWWDAYKYANFKELVVVEKVFDLAVNMGGFAAHKLLQKSINIIGSGTLKVDGLLGGLTFGAANRSDPKLLRSQLRVCASQRYMEILAANPNMEWAKNGWMRRAKW